MAEFFRRNGTNFKGGNEHHHQIAHGCRKGAAANPLGRHCQPNAGKVARNRHHLRETRSRWSVLRLLIVGPSLIRTILVHFLLELMPIVCMHVNFCIYEYIILSLVLVSKVIANLIPSPSRFFAVPKSIYRVVFRARVRYFLFPVEVMVRKNQIRNLAIFFLLVSTRWKLRANDPLLYSRYFGIEVKTPIQKLI